ncbi:N-acetylmuramoyl-L-alanine amidase family protein [Sphingobacterium faecale]|uniref:N-acetylmuramoyl-L-alanine amidase n=1 Tax=Sphingobacterium faecale TaxID=2803775 RepID=A0ABS1R605_9SPHI|nr:N-acetylmuramoyl-L-alanine amidase [Sphingobacterium faecale]MBL1409994.1 N-acetylmuramoyl-L-alanine amidase [Sphingobacterium faecale]
MKFLNIVKKLSFTLLTSSFLVTSVSFAAITNDPPVTKNKKTFTIVIDPGHGGPATGAAGRRSLEKNLVLDVSKKLKTELENKLGINVIMTRTTDVDIPFRTRSEIANKNNADIFLSIHANSTSQRTSKASGTETFVLGFHRMSEQDVAIRENADMLLHDDDNSDLGNFDPKDPSSYIVFKLMRRQYRDRSIRFASYIQHEYTASKRVDRGVKEQGLAVLARASMPAVLTEIGFINNAEEENYMLSDEGQAEIVENLFQAIKKYKTATEK